MAPARNVNGGMPCRMTEAKGYSRRKPHGRKRYNRVSGIYSHATEWEGFEYNEDHVSAALGVPMPKFKAYNPVGMIKQAPACRVDYNGKGPAGGRKCPSSYLGAALRTRKEPLGMRVYLRIEGTAIRMSPQHMKGWNDLDAVTT